MVSVDDPLVGDDVTGSRSDPTSTSSINDPLVPEEPQQSDAQDDAEIQRTRFLTIEAEIPSADDATLAAMGIEVDTLTRLPAVERAWLIDQIDVETRRRTS
jgi:hypothetical protein